MNSLNFRSDSLTQVIKVENTTGRCSICRPIISRRSGPINSDFMRLNIAIVSRARWSAFWISTVKGKGKCLRTCPSAAYIGVGDGGSGARAPPQKKIGKNIFGQLLCKIQIFFGQNHVKYGKFVNISGKYHKNSGSLLFFSDKNRVKFGHLVDFSYIFFGQKCLVSLKLTELLSLWLLTCVDSRPAALYNLGSVSKGSSATISINI